MAVEQKIIDVWMQQPTREFVNHPMFASLRRWMGMGLLEEDLPVEWTLDSMDQAGVNLGLLSAWYGPAGPLISNEQVAALVEAHPDRFKGLASVNLWQPMEAIRELTHYVKDMGFMGVRQVQWFWNLPATDRHYYPLYARCVELDVPICFQVGHTGPLCPSEPGRPIPYIDEVAIDFPELKMVCGHIGYPWTQEMIAVATKHPNVYIDTSAYTAKRFPPELVHYMKTNGKKKVMFGTNYPMIPHAKCLEGLDSLELDAEVRELFLYRNAAAVFRLG
ncbi:MAG: amidohydrolase [Desulfatibacillum sp.]|nr:amidohydrolase [Desulfatibacillum sp.]